MAKPVAVVTLQSTCLDAASVSKEPHDFISYILYQLLLLLLDK